MKKYLCAALFLVTCHCFANKASIVLEGLYDCTGTEVGTGTPYKCQMIINKTGETYTSTASCDDGTSYTGTGIFDEKTHHLSTAFINTKKTAETGVALSDVKPDGTMTTLWTYLNRTTIGSSTCKKHQ